MNYFIHPLADVKTKNIGERSRVEQFSVIFSGAKIGVDVNVYSHCLIENDVTIGDRVTVKPGVQLWDGLRVGDDVQIGPNVSFSQKPSENGQENSRGSAETIIHDAVSIGAGAVISCGISIGRNAVVAAGAVITRSIPPNAVVVGDPAKIVGYVNASAGSSLEPVHGNAEVGSAKTNVSGVTLLRLPLITDIRGNLTAGEFERTIPFEVKRYFMVFDVPSIETRGEHAHHECHQFLICVRGSCAVVADDGVNRQEFLLDRPDIGIHLPPMVWGIQYKYSPDAVLLVFASHYYDSADYIRDYSYFLRIVGAKS